MDYVKVQYANGARAARVHVIEARSDAGSWYVVEVIKSRSIAKAERIFINMQHETEQPLRIIHG